VFAGCFSQDDLGRNIFLEVNDAIIFENNRSYILGDTIYVDVKFSRYLDETNQANKLDIFKSSGSEAFRYDFRLNKFSTLSNDFQRISISPEFIFAEKGTLDDFNSFRATLNPENDLYESRIGIILGETGIFRLELNFVAFSSDNFSRDNVFIDIRNRFTQENMDFEFVVAE